MTIPGTEFKILVYTNNCLLVQSYYPDPNRVYLYSTTTDLEHVRILQHVKLVSTRFSFMRFGFIITNHP